MNRIETDVCVIGAGLAGLTAARRLSQGGREVTVVVELRRWAWSTSRQGAWAFAPEHQLV